MLDVQREKVDYSITPSPHFFLNNAATSKNKPGKEMENPSSTKCILLLQLLLLSRIVQDDFSRMPTSAANIFNHVTNTDALPIKLLKENAYETIQVLIYPSRRKLLNM